MKVNYCGGVQQERMIKNGWKLMIAQFGEYPDELFERMSKFGYTKIKVYYNSTAIRGIHSYFAMVKR